MFDYSPIMTHTHTQIVFNNNYNIWRKDRKGKGGGVMIMMRKELLVKSVALYGEGKAEIVSVNLENKNGEMMMIIAT